jgi:hypothetical protein
LTTKAPYKGLGADSEEKQEPVSDLDTAAADSLKALDLEWPIREADIELDAICGKIKNEDDRREAMSLARIFLSARENAQRCAVDCAPYVHAKLQAVQHEHGPTGRYVIADRPLSEAEWIRERATVIDVPPEG